MRVLGRTVAVAVDLADLVRPQAHRVHGPRMLPGVKLSILTPAYHESAAWPRLETWLKPMPAALYQKATWRDGAEALRILLRRRFQPAGRA